MAAVTKNWMKHAALVIVFNHQPVSGADSLLISKSTAVSFMAKTLTAHHTIVMLQVQITLPFFLKHLLKSQSFSGNNAALLLLRGVVLNSSKS